MDKVSYFIDAQKKGENEKTKERKENERFKIKCRNALGDIRLRESTPMWL